VLLLIGNKRDVTHGEREVSIREGERLAEVTFMNCMASCGNIKYCHTSNWELCSWRPVPGQGIMSYKLMRSWQGEGWILLLMFILFITLY